MSNSLYAILEHRGVLFFNAFTRSATVRSTNGVVEETNKVNRKRKRLNFLDAHAPSQ